MLELLRLALRRRDVFAPGSERWSDPRRRLLEGPAWQQARPAVCHSLKLPADAQQQLAHVAAQLDEAYRYVQHTVDPAVIRRHAGKDRLHLPELENLPEPQRLRRLRQQVWELVPSTELPALLLEVHQWTGFLNAFAPLGGGKGRISDIDISVCAALIADACNIGLEPLLDRTHPGLSRDRLSWVDQNYLRAETIAAANALLDSRLALAQKFGTGAIASVDGLRFVVPVKTINAGPNPRYFGHGSGVTYLNGVSDQLAGFFAIVIPSTIRDSLYILDGLLEHDTGLDPQIIVTDTASYSDQVFGLFSLLGYQFAPRLADIPEQRFWRIDPTADYGPFNG
ncbi:MAG: Tn3 family transposase, partial [Solirubrobacteraceae bacterium]